jgi:two-component system chemotaxis response regulator CheB
MTFMEPFKVLVVDDSAFMRKLISDLVMQDPRYKVIATARNGEDAIEKTKQLKPDIITMDIEMPEMNGLEALRLIMEIQPTPIVMLSSLTADGAEETIRALELGAVDFVRKPSGSISMDLEKIQSVLLEKLKLASQTKVFNYKKTQLPASPTLQSVPKAIKERVSFSKKKTFEDLVAIGTSTGGPRALQQVITQLPANFPAPLLIVQHMPPNFTKSLAQRLDSLSEIHVVEAEDGQLIENGVAYIAPGGWHMKMSQSTDQQYRIQLTKEEPRSGHRPSVDMMYESLLPHQEFRKHLVIMTGMGSDGAKAMKALYDSGVESTIAESEQTCIVYGMPRSAIELKAAMHVLPLQDIAGKLIELVMPNSKS